MASVAIGAAVAATASSGIGSTIILTTVGTATAVGGFFIGFFTSQSKPRQKEESKKPSAKPAPKKPSAKSAPKKPNAKAAPKKPSAKPAPKKPNAKAVPKKPSAKSAPKKPSAKPKPVVVENVQLAAFEESQESTVDASPVGEVDMPTGAETPTGVDDRTWVGRQIDVYIKEPIRRKAWEIIHWTQNRYIRWVTYFAKQSIEAVISGAKQGVEEMSADVTSTSQTLTAATISGAKVAVTDTL